MKRLYEKLLQKHLATFRQMIFLAGPRQVGKTTCALALKKLTKTFHYLNWDVQDQRRLIISGPTKTAEYLGLEKASEKLPIVVFDEIHKYGKWKHFLKGFFDAYSHRIKIVVTGSAKLNIYRSGGDSLMGRYFLYRLHPLSIAEILSPTLPKTEIRKPKAISPTLFKNLLEFGGFPEPYLKKQKRFSNHWHRLKQQQLIHEDIRSFSHVHELAQLDLFAELLRDQVGQLVNYSNLANATNASVPTVQRWLKSLEAFYYCFTIKPWSKNIKRTLRKTPKIYLWDWSEVSDPGMRCENFVASHLLKAVHFWTDYGLGDYDLYFLRDKEKNEVDFLVTKDRKPWFLVEVKRSHNHGVTSALHYFQRETGAEHAFQAVFDMQHVAKDCFSYKEPVIVPVQTLLSQLI